MKNSNGLDPYTVVFLGRSGCGKGTQAKLLMEKLSAREHARRIFHLETGVRFREFIRGEGYTHELSNAIYSAGGIQPEFLVIWMWGGAFIERLAADDHIVLDGTPRKFHEAHVLDSAFKFYGRKRPVIIHLNVRRDWAEERLLARRRSDDTAKDIKARLDWYETDVAPVVEFYRTNPEYHFADISGERSIGEVHADILKNLE